MIKIYIPNKETKKKEYFEILKSSIIERAKSLALSLEDLKGTVITLNKRNNNTYRYITEKIVKTLIKNVTKDSKEYNKANYVDTVNDILKNNKEESDLDNVNFIGLLSFLKELVDSNEVLLQKILICEASELKRTNEKILAQYNISKKLDELLLKHVFNYEVNDISNKIKEFFRDNNFVNFCPYCNDRKVEFKKTLQGRIINSHELDHFFDKASHPLLACSFFNLIPSDTNCNRTNKGTIHFTDEFHLNPYARGFKKDFMFIAKPTVYNIERIDLLINVARGTEIRKQILGSREDLTEDDLGNKEQEKGNANVFLIKSKYEDKTSEAKKILEAIRAKDNNMSMLKNYLKLVGGQNWNNVYKDWYIKKMETSFEPRHFNDKANSKFNRDIHDSYYKNNTKIRNKFILDMIK